MAAVTTELKVLVRAVGKNDLDKISDSLTKLGQTASSAVNPKVKQSVGELKKLSDQSVKTRANVQGFSNAFKDLANNLEFGSKEFKEATAEAARLDAQLRKLETRKAPTLGQRLRRGAQTAGAVAAGGVFGGPEGAIGGLIGAAGGPAGAAVGAAIGAQVGQVRQALGETARYSANLTKLRIALKGVTTSQEEYGDALDFIQESTKRFAIPQDIITRQFTKLQASVQGAGGSIEDTKTAFNGIVASVRATGGSLQDIDSALTATAQVFSKGKVSAEELRQQIGERLPGAFSLFAKSLGITPQELDKALEDGKVSLQDFQTFAEEIFKKYGLTAEIIASSPEAAGDRLSVALSNLSESVGRLLQPIGEAFQRVFTAIVEQIDRAARALDSFLGISDDSRIEVLNRQIQESNDKLLSLQRDLRAAKQADTGSDLFGGADAFGPGPGAVRGAGGGVAAIQAQIDEVARERGLIEKELSDLNALRALRGDIQQARPGDGLPSITDPALDGTTNERVDASKTLLDLAEKLNAATLSGNEFAIVSAKLAFDKQKIEEGTLLPRQKAIALLALEGKANRDILRLLSAKPEKVKEFTQELTESQKVLESMKKTIEDGLVNAIEGLVDGTKSLRQSLADILKQMAGLFLRAGIGSFKGADGTGGSGLLGLFADGGVIAKNNVVPFAYGGIVDKPTLFPMANGAGLMGEAGPEGILPLRRNSKGRLGVEASGGSVGNVVVNVDASGSAVEGNDAEASQLGKVIGIAVQQELVKQKRPGGLLAN
jgi:tape measure domain-containing protein